MATSALIFYNESLFHCSLLAFLLLRSVYPQSCRDNVVKWNTHVNLGIYISTYLFCKLCLMLPKLQLIKFFLKIFFIYEDFRVIALNIDCIMSAFSNFHVLILLFFTISAHGELLTTVGVHSPWVQ